MLGVTISERLQVLRAAAVVQKDQFYSATPARRAELFAAIKTARNRLLDDSVREVTQFLEPSSGLNVVLERMRHYFDQSDWALLDLVALATCLDAPVDAIATKLAPNALMYHCLRMVDDVLDVHHHYKGGAQTLFGYLAERGYDGVHGNILPATLLIARHAHLLPPRERQLFERTTIGMLHESFPAPVVTLNDYRRIAAGKMGSYGSFLYSPVVAMFASHSAAIVDFLDESFVLSQVANDLYDRNDDAARGQPNFWHVVGDHDAAMRQFEGDIERWAARADDVGTAQRYAHARIADLLTYVLQAPHPD